MEAPGLNAHPLVMVEENVTFTWSKVLFSHEEEWESIVRTKIGGPEIFMLSAISQDQKDK